MGVDLSLLPLDHETTPIMASSVLRLTGRSALWEPIESLPARPISELTDEPRGMLCHKALTPVGEDGFGFVAEDRYGAGLKYVTAADLLSLDAHEAVRDNPTNRAIWAYLGELAPEKKIVLFWH